MPIPTVRAGRLQTSYGASHVAIPSRRSRGACRPFCLFDPLDVPADQRAALPEAIKVPSGHHLAFAWVGSGKLLYECRPKAGNAAQLEWVFIGPTAQLTDRLGRAMGRYFVPPATWESSDGSRVTGAQLAVAPAAPGSIPLQLVKASAAGKAGQLSAVTYIQRLATRGGVPSAATCKAATAGTRTQMDYAADYLFGTAG